MAKSLGTETDICSLPLSETTVSLSQLLAAHLFPRLYRQQAFFVSLYRETAALQLLSFLNPLSSDKG